MTAITPTLGQLRERLRRDGMPGPREEFTFDLDTEDRSFYPLPDCYVVGRRTCERVLEGDYDHYPDSIPIEELDL